MNDDDGEKGEKKEDDPSKGDQTEDDQNDQKERAYDLNDPRPEPGITAPLDDVTEEEAKSGPAGVLPGAGPEPDEIEHGGVEAQDAREDQKERASSGDETTQGEAQDRDQDEQQDG